MPQMIFVYEFITSGGLLSVGSEAPTGSLLREGAAMFTALVEDLVRIPGVTVVAMRDFRVEMEVSPTMECSQVESTESEKSHFDKLAANADWTIVIAPEFDELLLDRTRRVESLGGRLLGPNSRIVALGTFKDKFVSHLKMRGVRTTRGYRYAPGCLIPTSLRFPAILKPYDGAGSQGVRRIENRESFPVVAEGTYRLEELVPGIPASVAVLCGPNSQIVLPGCRQNLTADGSFSYLGGSVPLDDRYRFRAERLAAQALATLPDCRGYVGVDMVLGKSASSDTVIELNPRMTTSYVGLRRLARGNLAAALLDVAEDKTPDLCFDDGPVEFLADGTILSS